MLDDLLKAMMGGTGAQPPSGGQTGDDPLADLLGSLAGGGAPSGGGDVSDLLGGLLGSGAGQGAGDTGDLMNLVMGGAGPDIGSSSLLAPIAKGIAEKLGLPPQMAQLIVSFVLGKLLSGRMAGGGARGAGLASEAGLDLDDLLGRMGSGQGLDTDFMQASGLAGELAQHTGLDSDTAARGLQEAFQTLGGQLGGGQQPQSGPQPGQLGLDDLLDSW